MSTTIFEHRDLTGYPSDAKISKYNTLPRDLRLSALDHDVLTILLEGLPIRSLRSLSSTSWHVRRLCLPVLFKRCLVASECPIQRYSFPPEPLWRHVRGLRLVDKCPDMPEHENLYMEPREEPILTFATDPLVCCLYDGPVLSNALSHMPRLHSISLELNYRTIHGIPWPVLQIILSLPQLREFALKYHRLAPKTPPEEIRLDRPAPLTSFQFTLNDRRPRDTRYHLEESEEHATNIILSGVHKTMEQLVLATESAPIDAICTTFDWPNLRELRLRGVRRTVGNPPLPTVAMFAHMTRLRVLDLKLAQPAGIPAQSVWPANYQTTFPWPELQHFSISCPVENDKIYAHLPPTLHTLGLQYFPHVSMLSSNLRAPELQWPLQSASAVLRILHQCDLPLLRCLELEYREDHAEDELLRYLRTAFPALTQLKLRRYRREGAYGADVQVEHIARALGSLPHLSDLSLHLDNVNVRETSTSPWNGGFGHSDHELMRYQMALDGIANVVARGLGAATSLETFKLLRPPNYWLVSKWMPYRIERGEGLLSAACLSRV